MPYKDPVQRNAYARKWYSENSQAHKARVARNNAKATSWYCEFKKTLSCARCGESHPACLDFHHDNPEQKEIAIYQAIRLRWGERRVREEIAKCTVLCSNCHRKHHSDTDSAGPGVEPGICGL